MKCSFNVLVVQSTEYSSFLEFYFLGNFVLDVYTEKAVCNEKCKHGLGRDPFLLSGKKEIIYSIRLVPGSSPGQPTTIR